MLVLRYFIYVGGSLVALLLLCAALLPKPPIDDNTVASASDVPAIQIHSRQKWPERIVLDTNAAMPAPATVAQAPSEQAKARVREAFAELPADGSKGQAAAADVKKPEPKPPVKRRVARARPAPPRGYAYQQGYYGYPQQYYPQARMQVAQQPRFGSLW
jgi:hypothetical protein